MKNLRLPTALAVSFGLFGFAPRAVQAAGALGKASWVLLSPKGGANLTNAPGHVLHVVVYTAAPQYYQTQLTHDIAAALPAGKFLHYQFQARSATKNPLYVVIEKRTAPYTHFLDKTVVLTPAWKQYAFDAKIPTAYSPGGRRGFSLASKPGQLSLKLSLSAPLRDTRDIRQAGVLKPGRRGPDPSKFSVRK